MNKKEILDKKLFYNKGITFTEYERSVICEAMEEWAKQESMELIKFMSDNDYWIFKEMIFSPLGDDPIPLNELYLHYLQSKQ